MLTTVAVSFMTLTSTIWQGVSGVFVSLRTDRGDFQIR